MSARVQVCYRMLTSLMLLVIVGAAGDPSSLRAAQDSKLRVMFYGYVERQPRVAFAVIDGNRVSDVTDVPYLRHGGEISPDGTRIAFDTCRTADRRDVGVPETSAFA